MARYLRITQSTDKRVIIDLALTGGKLVEIGNINRESVKKFFLVKIEDDFPQKMLDAILSNPASLKVVDYVHVPEVEIIEE